VLDLHGIRIYDDKTAFRTGEPLRVIPANAIGKATRGTGLEYFEWGVYVHLIPTPDMMDAARAASCTAARASSAPPHRLWERGGGIVGRGSRAAALRCPGRPAAGAAAATTASRRAAAAAAISSSAGVSGTGRGSARGAFERSSHIWVPELLVQLLGCNPVFRIW
jgi:hypothetical protein